MRSIDGWTTPIDVEIQTPDGVQLMRGSRSLHVTPALGRTSQEFEFELQLDRVPADDLVIIATSQARHGGVRAETRYRFGRQEPFVVAPSRAGPHIKTPRADFGRAVPIL